MTWRHAKDGYTTKLQDGHTDDKGYAEFDLDLKEVRPMPPTGWISWPRPMRRRRAAMSPPAPKPWSPATTGWSATDG